MRFDNVKAYREWSDWVADNVPSTRYEIQIDREIKILNLIFGAEEDRILYTLKWS